MKSASFLLAAVVSGCTSEAARGKIDSLEVRTVISKPSPARWSLGIPRLTIGDGAAGPEYALFRTQAVKRHQDGRIVVSVGQAELRVYDAAGRYVRTLGRRGQGPGEFRQLWDFWFWEDDSIAAFNFYPVFVDVFAPDGRFVRRVGFEPRVPQPSVLGRLDGGRFIGTAQTGLPAPDVPSLFESTQRLLAYDGDGTLRDTLAVVDPVLWWGTSRSY